MASAHIRRKGRVREKTRARVGALERKEQKNSGKIFKHDVAITSDQRGIFHPPPLRSTKSRGRDEPTSIPPPSIRPSPLLRIINGQFAASAADCIVSPFSGFPSFGCQVPSPSLSLSLFPHPLFSPLPLARIRILNLPSVLPHFHSTPFHSFLQIFLFLRSSLLSRRPNPSKFVKGRTRERWAGHDVT